MSNARNLANLLTGGDTTIATGDVANDAVTAAKIDDDGTGFQMGDLTLGTTLTVGTAVLPDASGGADIGSASAEFGDVYIADDKQIKFGSDQDVTMEYDEDGTDTLLISGDVTIADGSNDFDIASHDGTNGLKLGGTLVTATAANLNSAASTGKAIAMAMVFG